VSLTSRLTAFEENRARLLALAYRMLGDLARAEDMVQEAWLRWERQDDGEVVSPQAFLVTIVTRLCLNELDSARARREENRSDRLPEPIDLEVSGFDQVERLEQVSMAFLVALQRLTPAERAVLLMHEVFELSHHEISSALGGTVEGSRKSLERARQSLASERRMLLTTADEHRRILDAFVSAVRGGDMAGVVNMLADDATIVTDGGVAGTSIRGQRNLSEPLHGASRVAAFVVAATARATGAVRFERHELNGQPGLVLWTDDRPLAAILLGVVDGKVARIYFHGDERRLRHIGAM